MGVPLSNYYDLLGVSPNAEIEVITAAYKAMIRKYHPDINKSASASDRTKAINEAYEVLKDPLQRQDYDAKLAEGRTNRGAPPPPPPPPPPTPPPSPTPPSRNEVSSSGRSRELGAWAKYAAACAAVIAILLWLYDAHYRSVRVETVSAGKGQSPTVANVVKINYVGKLADGRIFDQGQGVVLPVAEVIPGLSAALQQMQPGGKYTVHIPSQLAYGTARVGPIPPNSDLTFSIELIDYKNASTYKEYGKNVNSAINTSNNENSSSIENFNIKLTKNDLLYAGKLAKMGYINDTVSHIVGPDIPSGIKYRGFILNLEAKDVDAYVTKGYFKEAAAIYQNNITNKRDANAAHNLGLMYSRGLGVQKDRSKALELLKFSRDNRKWDADSWEIQKLLDQ